MCWEGGGLDRHISAKAYVHGMFQRKSSYWYDQSKGRWVDIVAGRSGKEVESS